MGKGEFMNTQSFQILLATHGDLGKGYLHTLGIILDMPEDEISIVSFQAQETLESFEERFQEKVNAYDDQHLVILLDLPGGTPANIALRFLHPARTLIAGFNLPFLLELVLAKMNQTPWEDFHLSQSLQHAKDSMICYNDLFHKEEQL